MNRTTIVTSSLLFLMATACPAPEDEVGECDHAVACDEMYYVVDDEESLAAVADCESIGVDLIFGRQDWLTVIDLPCLVSVGDILFIEENDALTTIDLPALETIGGDLQLHGDDVLSAVDLPALTTVGDDLQVYGNASLDSLTGLSALTAVGDALHIHENPCLSQADAESFATSIEVGGEVVVEDNGADHPCD
jgi:hypothetical protein